MAESKMEFATTSLGGGIEEMNSFPVGEQQPPMSKGAGITARLFDQSGIQGGPFGDY